jgi:hypothetical protein
MKTSSLKKLQKTSKNIWNDSDLVLIFAPLQRDKISLKTAKTRI